MSLDNLLEWYRRLDAYIIPSGEVGQQGRGTIVDGFPVDKRVDTLCTDLWTRLGLRDACPRHVVMRSRSSAVKPRSRAVRSKPAIAFGL